MMESQRSPKTNDPGHQADQTDAAAYVDNLDHLLDELQRLDLYLQRAVQSFRQHKPPEKPTEFRGYYISDEEVDRIFARKGEQYPRQDQALTALIHKQAALIMKRVAATTGTGRTLRLLKLIEAFSLGELEKNLVLMTLAPEIDSNYQILYAYLQDDLTCRLPTIDLARRLFCNSLAGQVRLRAILSAAHPLVRNHIFSIVQRPGPSIRGFQDNAVKLDERIVRFLYGLDGLDDRLVQNISIAHWAIPNESTQSIVLNREAAESLNGVVRLANVNAPWLCHLQGPNRVDTLAAALAVCERLRRPMVVFDVAAARAAEIPLTVSLRLILREANLYGAVLYIDGWMESDPPIPAIQSEALAAEAELNAWCLPTIIGSTKSWQPELNSPYRFAQIRLPVPDESLRYKIWQRCLDRYPGLADKADIEQLAGAYRLSEGQIRRATTHAQNLADMRTNGENEVSPADLVAACRVESSRKLLRLALRVTPMRTWSDLVVPADVRFQLEEFCRQVSRRMTVYNDWGFADKFTLGRATVALFTGCSGVGKTLGAEIVAHELGKDLYKVDLSAVVSKYIGETEKNLDSLFAEAHDGSALLFFDECDALFGKRTEIKDAHDKYANTESSFLLMKLEEFEGDVIMATNMSGNIDPAFRRRIRLLVDFPFPDESLRRRIWEGVFPERAPLADDVDFDLLARNFRITGGNIRNVALAAAFRVAENGKPIGMREIILSMKREYRKIGKICDRAEFGPYLELTER
jgi:SpoVK/Ycf46/Vps4 family AAA+-type ATPase